MSAHSHGAAACCVEAVNGNLFLRALSKSLSDKLPKWYNFSFLCRRRRQSFLVVKSQEKLILSI